MAMGSRYPELDIVTVMSNKMLVQGLMVYIQPPVFFKDRQSLFYKVEKNQRKAKSPLCYVNNQITSKHRMM